MIDIIAHRGYWLELEEQNTVVAFERALTNGFGIETDLRDRSQDVVISHDMATLENITLERFITLCLQAPDVTLALNVKADGLQEKLAALTLPQPHFYFDMSVPDMLGYLRHQLAVYTRYSDIELAPALYEHCEGVWLDNFKDNVLDESALEKFLEAGKRVVLVSPELHKRCKKAYWQQLREFLRVHPIYQSQVGICTDFPLDARNYFNEY